MVDYQELLLMDRADSRQYFLFRINKQISDVDLVVSDVEMPRMNGFEMTENMRSDDRFEDLPHILCTSLASREDRERGVDVRVNAYIMKSSFDQSDLLDVISKFI